MNWDEIHSKIELIKTDQKIVNNALSFLNKIQPNKVPSITVSAHGCIQLEWIGDVDDLQIEIAETRINVYHLTTNNETSDHISLPLNDRVAQRIRSIINTIKFDKERR